MLPLRSSHERRNSLGESRIGARNDRVRTSAHKARKAGLPEPPVRGRCRQRPLDLQTPGRPVFEALTSPSGPQAARQMMRMALGRRCGERRIHRGQRLSDQVKVQREQPRLEQHKSGDGKRYLLGGVAPDVHAEQEPLRRHYRRSAMSALGWGFELVGRRDHDVAAAWIRQRYVRPLFDKDRWQWTVGCVYKAIRGLLNAGLDGEGPYVPRRKPSDLRTWVDH